MRTKNPLIANKTWPKPLGQTSIIVQYTQIGHGNDKRCRID